MFEQLKKCSLKIRYQLREVYKITQYKDNCVWRTKSLGYIVCGPDYRLLNMKDIQIGSVSTKISRELL